ncbi:MAG: KGK domain-containing protein [Cyanobacteriota bacterium]|nr:KGK domain-containing protein [Cyanobacteriota bacterium]
MAENSDNQEFVVLNWDDVVELDQNVCKYLGLDTNNFQYLYLIIEQLKSVIIRNVNPPTKLPGYIALDIKEKLFSNGLDFYFLRPGAKNWEKEKFKVELTVKFDYDEPEEEIEENESENYGDKNLEYLEIEASPLDDLRQKFNHDNK